LIDRAIDYWLKAGQLALAGSAHAEAITQLTKGLRLLDRLVDDATCRDKEIDLQLALAGAFILAAGQASSDARDAFSRARSLCQQAGVASRLGEATHGLCLFNENRADLAASVEAATDLLHYAKQENDAAAELVGHQRIAICMVFEGNLSRASRHFTQALALQAKMPWHSNQRLGYHWGPGDGAHTLSSWALLLQGHIDQALAKRSNAVASARASNYPHRLAVALHQTCVSYQVLADPGEVERYSTELIALTQEQGYAHWLATGTMFRGWCIAVGGEREKGLAEMRRGLVAKQATGAELKVPYYLGLMAALSGETAHADTLPLFAEALVRIERTGERWFEAELHRLKGDVLLRAGGPSIADAEVEFQRALAIAREQGARFWQLRAGTSLARLWSDLGRYEGARSLLAPVYA
jgi:predicted ATPase